MNDIRARSNQERERGRERETEREVDFENAFERGFYYFSCCLFTKVRHTTIGGNQRQ